MARPESANAEAREDGCQRMMEDIAAKAQPAHAAQPHLELGKRFAAWLKRSPDTLDLK
jgi:hypothetical protein